MWESCSKTHVFISALKPNSAPIKHLQRRSYIYAGVMKQKECISPSLEKLQQEQRKFDPLYLSRSRARSSVSQQPPRKAPSGDDASEKQSYTTKARSHVSTGHSGNPGNNAKQAPRAQSMAVCCYTCQLWRWNHTLHLGCNTAKPYGTQTHTNQLLKTQTGAHLYVCMFRHSNTLARITPACS